MVIWNNCMGNCSGFAFEWVLWFVSSWMSHCHFTSWWFMMHKSCCPFTRLMIYEHCTCYIFWGNWTHYLRAPKYIILESAVIVVLEHGLLAGGSENHLEADVWTCTQMPRASSTVVLYDTIFAMNTIVIHLFFMEHSFSSYWIGAGSEWHYTMNIKGLHNPV